MEMPERPKQDGFTVTKVQIITAVVVLVLIAILGYLFFIYFQKKPTPAPPPPVKTTTSKPNPLAQFDGSWAGTSPDHEGITSVAVNIGNGQISGTANYVETGLTIVLTVTGTVTADGAVMGNLSGSGSEGGQTFTVSGTYTGKIASSTFNLSYTGSGNGKTASGNLVLTKK